jgi:hypothetical protein
MNQHTLTLAALLLPLALPPLYLMRWWSQLRRPWMFFIFAQLSSIGLLVVAFLLSGFVLENGLRALLGVAPGRPVGATFPQFSYVVLAFDLIVSCGLLVPAMHALRRNLGQHER